MKKKTNMAAAALTAAALLTAPMTAGASETAYVTPNPDSWACFFTQGDVNGDGAVSVADAVSLQKFLNTSSGSVSALKHSGNLVSYDMNLDGSIDVFDMVILRRLLIAPETAGSYTAAVDKVAGIRLDSEMPPSLSPEECSYPVISDRSELEASLNEYLTDEADVQRFMERYSEDFFRDNFLVICPGYQEYGDGVFITLTRPFLLTVNSGQSFLMSMTASDYTAPLGLYPKHETAVLQQFSVPRSQLGNISGACVLPLEQIFSPDNNTVTYISPDGSRELVVTQASFLLCSDIQLWEKTSDGGFIRLADFMADDGGQPFDSEGEWSVDDQGRDVYSGDTYSITWGDDGVIVAHDIMTGGRWEVADGSYVYTNGNWEAVTVRPDGSVSDTWIYTP